MTTIRQLSGELLPEIFENLKFCDLIEAQHVCRAWYFPAHVLLLKDIRLYDEDDVGKFIHSIDQNANTSYLAAVKKINITSCEDEDWGVGYRFDKDSIMKLICRFHNITHVLIGSDSYCLEELDEEMCHTIVKKCPKLNYFAVDLINVDETTYCSKMYTLRSLVTALKVDRVGSATEYGGATRFITSFPRLQDIYGYIGQRFSKFQDYLPIFEQLSKVQSLEVMCSHYDYADQVENFAERYLAGKTKEQRDLIVKRLSILNNLTYTSHHPFSPNSIKFIAKYFTGLKKLKIHCYYNHEQWSTVHQQVLMNEMTSLVVKDHGVISLGTLELSVMVEILPTIVHKFFSQLPINNRVLLVGATNYPHRLNEVNLHMEWATTRQVDIAFSDKLNTYNTLRAIFNSHTYHDVDEFEFYISNRARYSNDMQIDFGSTFNPILETIPSLKKITFDIPASFVHHKRSEQPHQYPRIETLTLRPTINLKLQQLLKTFAYMFPKLKYLNLYYYTGAVNLDMRNVYIDLANYTLERLAIDLTFVKLFVKVQSVKSNFFVVQVESMEKQERYKISLDLSPVSSIADKDSQDNVYVHIIANKLKSLDGYMCKKNGSYERLGDTLYYNSLERFTIF